jgi:GT2 family glycosyltransferase
MSEVKPHVSIILLNWNGWQDTIECLESIQKSTYENFNVILIDNDSSDDSLEQIKAWASGNSKHIIDTRYSELVKPLVTKPIKLFEYLKNELSSFEKYDSENGSILLVKNRTNLGFALANNQGMDIARQVFTSHFYFLLNNDTVIEKNSISDLVTVMTDGAGIAVAQPIIYSYEENKIVNAGGKIFFWGQTRHFKSINRDEVRPISFVNGCALFVRATVISEFGKLSDKFFHGEEDFEFSKRMNKYKQKMVCSGRSHVYHKVGVSVKKLMQNYESRTFLFALNRTVDLKDYYPWPIWYIWRLITLMYFFYLFWIKYRVPLKRTLFLIKKVNKYSGELKDVQKNTVERIYTELNLL